MDTSAAFDRLGQVKAGKRYWSDWTPVAGQQFEYGFDDIGNRTGTKAGGDENGASLRAVSYTNNALNQITGRGVPGYVDVLGVALATNAVTVNSQTAYRRAEYFRKELAVENTSALWTNITVSSAGTNASGNRFVAAAGEGFGYDLDGNLTNGGRWVLTWDAEIPETKRAGNEGFHLTEDWVGMAAVAEHLKISRRTMYNWMR